MKNLTYAKKKWLTTSALLAVLAVNVSFNPGIDGNNMASFASTEVKVPTRNGLMKVKYEDNGEKEVLAIIPKKNPEGQFCPTCGYDTIALQTDNKTDFDALNVQLLNIIDKQETEKAEKLVVKKEKNPKNESKSKSKKEDDEDDDIDEAKEKGPFDGIEEKCEKKSEEDEVLTCLQENFLRVLKSKKAKNIESREALSFFKSEIQSRLVRQISEAKRISARSRRSAFSQGGFISLMNSSDQFKDPEAMISEVGNAISEMISEIPSKFEIVRRTLINAETDILKYQAAQYKEVQNRALTTKDPAELPMLLVEKDALAHQFNFFQNEFYNRNEDSLARALGNNNITDQVHDEYQKYLLNFNTNLGYSLSGKNSFLDNMTMDPLADLSGRMSNPGRYNGSIGINPLNNLSPMNSRSPYSSDRGSMMPLGQNSRITPLPIQPNSNGRMMLPMQSRPSYWETSITPNSFSSRTGLLNMRQ